MASTDNTDVSSPQREQQRATIRQWGRESWPDPCEAILFRWNRFGLSEFSGREELGTLPLWRSISQIFFAILFVPVLYIYYDWLRVIPEALGVIEEPIKKKKKKESDPGAIVVEGSTRNPAPTALIDTVKRAPRSLWLVVSRARVAVVVAGKNDEPPRVVWQNDESATVELQHAVPNSIQITWPDECRASFYPTVEERQVVTRFVRSTWNDHR